MIIQGKRMITNKDVDKVNNRLIISRNQRTDKVNLFITWYDEKNPERLKEYLECLDKNVKNELINNIFILTETDPLKTSDFRWAIKETVKIKNEIMYSRPKYENIFNLINAKTGAYDINIIANTDIYFDTEGIRAVKDINFDNICLSLTRYDVKMDGSIVFYNKNYSQDSWIFKGRIKNVNGNFNLGTPGCDNRIAYELSAAGYSVFNPALDIKTYHIHNTEIRNYNKQNIVPKPYKIVPFCKVEMEKDYYKKHILHIGLNFSGQKTLVKSLSDLGKYEGIMWRPLLEQLNNNVNVLNQYIKEQICKFKPDLIFMQIQTANIIDPNMIKQIVEIFPNIKIVNWNGDIRENFPDWMLELAKIKNVYTMFSNMRDVEYLRALGFENTYYLQIGFEETFFGNNSIQYNTSVKDIIFTGNLYKQFPLYNLRIDTYKALKEKFGDKVKFYGSGWKEIDSNIAPFSFNFSGSLYSRAKICISINNINAKRYTSDRLLNMMACGAFCLVHYYEDIETDFKNNEHVVYWKTIDELIDLIEYWLPEKEKRKNIGDNAASLMYGQYRWCNRIEEMCKIIKFNKE
jgi:glycosyltransferase involved in cell wall biosynthesis